ncbi:unnamed protein product [Prorocentrum cordatum]|uniref:Uncharacterized protein n=1 Tax=Prorocentrum cordatum TaxID=2364126 RepID=A0ABN9PLX0_9DINO|nr:unnamed protein product [Polarella glacialis]
MRADMSQTQPLQLSLGSDCEPGEVAPARAPRAPRALAGAAALSAAAAVAALLAVVWRAGFSTGAVTVDSRGASVKAAVAGDVESCVVYGDSNVQMYGKAVGDNIKFTSPLGKPFWLVHSDTLFIQGVSDILNEGNPIPVLKAVGIGGPMLGWYTLEITTGEATWYSPEGSPESILETDMSVWQTAITSTDTLEAKLDHAGDVLQPDRKDKEMNVLHVKFGSVELQIDRWIDSDIEQFMNIKITKTVEAGESGLCGDGAVSAVTADQVAKPESGGANLASDAEDQAGVCSQTGASCAESKCCSEPGAKCYKKDDGWSSCNQTCDPNYRWIEDAWVKTNETVWDCEELVRPCSGDGENCAVTQCCSAPGAKCYKKNDYWFACNETCDPYYRGYVDGGLLGQDERDGVGLRGRLSQWSGRCRGCRGSDGLRGRPRCFCRLRVLAEWGVLRTEPVLR